MRKLKGERDTEFVRRIVAAYLNSQASFARVVIDVLSGKDTDAAASEVWKSVNVAPRAGSRIIAVYPDGSGARMFAVTDSGLICSDGDGWGLEHLEEHFCMWTYLPDDTEFWCELRSIDKVEIP